MGVLLSKLILSKTIWSLQKWKTTAPRETRRSQNIWLNEITLWPQGMLIPFRSYMMDSISLPVILLRHWPCRRAGRAAPRRSPRRGCAPWSCACRAPWAPWSPAAPSRWPTPGGTPRALPLDTCTPNTSSCEQTQSDQYNCLHRTVLAPAVKL